MIHVGCGRGLGISASILIRCCGFAGSGIGTKPAKLTNAGQHESRASGTGSVGSVTQPLFRGLMILLAGTIAFAAIVSLPPQANAAANPKYASIVINGLDGEVLFSRNADARRYPASLTKMMTLYLLFEQLEAGSVTLESKLPVSAYAASRPPSKLGVPSGRTIDVDTAIKALAVKSANDVATIVAEKLGGSESKFAAKMNLKAQQLGMTRTKFRNASGLPDSGQYTTARDMATLGRRLYHDFPQYQPYFALKSFQWSGRTYVTHNHMLKTYEGTDGIKTGYIRDSGFNIVTSVRRNDFHLIAVVMGGRTKYTRDDHMSLILDEQFARLRANPQMIASIKPKPLAKPAGFETASLQGESPVLPGPLVVSEGIAPAQSTQAGPTVEPISTLIAELEESGNQSAGSTAPKVESVKSSPSGINVVLPTSASSGGSDALQVAAAEGSNDDPIGELIAESRLGETAGTGQKLVNMAALGDGGRVNPSDPLSPRIVHSTVTGSLPTSSATDDLFGIQVGAYRYEEVAVQRLAAIFSRAPDVLNTAVLAIFPANVGGTTLYRARIGPYSKADAEDVCAALTSRGVTCYPDFAEKWQLAAQTLSN